MNNIKLFYYINLEKRQNRNINVINQSKKSKILSKDLVRFNAVDGQTINLSDVDPKILNNKGRQVIESNKILTYGVSLTYGSLGCAISHYSLFKLCAETNNGSILILEDDIIINDTIDNVLYTVDNIDESDYDIFYIGCHRSGGMKYDTTKYDNIYKLGGNFWGGFAYVITAKCCQYLIDSVFPIGVQFDSAILRHVHAGKINALGFKYNIIKTPGLFHSDNQGKNGLLKNRPVNNKKNADPWSTVFNDK